MIYEFEITKRATAPAFFTGDGEYQLTNFTSGGRELTIIGFSGVNSNLEMLREADILKFTIKTPIQVTNEVSEIDLYVKKTLSGGITNNVAYYSYSDKSTVDYNNLKVKLSTASATNPVILYFKVPTIYSRDNQQTASRITLENGIYGWIQYDLSKLHIDLKQVKGISYDSKNWKEFSIDGHLYNFRRANLPADEQTELSVLIDALDFSALAYTGAALTANQLTWADLIGEPALHTGVSVTGITHPAIDATGTLSANITFHRVLSDGTIEDYTKAVNIAFNLQAKPALAVWYADANGNVYKDGVKTYTANYSSTWTSANGVSVQSVYPVGNDVYVLLYSNDSSLPYMLIKNNKRIGYMTQSTMKDSGYTILHIDDTTVYFGGPKLLSAPLSSFTNGSVTPTLINSPSSVVAGGYSFYDNKIFYLADPGGLVAYDITTKTTTPIYSEVSGVVYPLVKILGKLPNGNYFGVLRATYNQRYKFWAFNSNAVKEFKWFSGDMDYQPGYGGIFISKVNETSFKVITKYSSTSNQTAMNVHTIDFSSSNIGGVVTQEDLKNNYDWHATGGYYEFPPFGIRYLIEDKGYIATTDKKIFEFIMPLATPINWTTSVKYTTEGSNPAVDWTNSRGA